MTGVQTCALPILVVRAKTEIEETKKGRMQIIVTEIPFQVNKARLIEKIAQLVKEKKIEGISYIRDESNREGMRIVIELKRDANPQITLNKLYKHTQLQESFSMIMLALVDGVPKILSLYYILLEYLKHQKIVLTRRNPDAPLRTRRSRSSSHSAPDPRRAGKKSDPSGYGHLEGRIG